MVTSSWNLSQIILQWTESELLSATKVMYLHHLCLQCETPNNVEEVDVPNVTVATFMNVRKFKQILWGGGIIFDIVRTS